MASIRLITQAGLVDVTIRCVFTPVAGSDEDVALARAVLVALNTDRRAHDDDTLPNPNDDDRRGWWADLDAQAIWGGWPIGNRLWLLTRAKLTDQNARLGSTVAQAQAFITECLQPFVDAKFCTSFDVVLTTLIGPAGPYGIGGTITLVRGPKSAIALAYQDLWSTYGG